MNIGVLTSSRADFGIYLPLLKKLKEDAFFDVTIIAFGTHSSVYHGETIDEVKKSGFDKIDSINSLLVSDDEQSIATSYGLTVIKFADYWACSNFDLVFCLGDRFEMSAAVQAGIPQEITFAHLHAGEKTLGAIDDVYRHQITHASNFHFTSTKAYAERVKELTESDDHIYNVGALSIDGINEIELLQEDVFRNKYKIAKGPFILTTFHPETVNYGDNEYKANEMGKALSRLSERYMIVISMPNADTMGTIYRKKISRLKEQFPEKAIVLESFGKSDYFAAMKYTRVLLGNSSSGIIEAASFNKYVVNVGNRQNGRVRSKNVIDCNFDSDQIIESVEQAIEKGNFEGDNIYCKEDSAKKIIEVLKQYNATL